MKIFFTLLAVVLFFTSCDSNKDISTMSEDECKKAGYIFTKNKKFNFRSGEYVVVKECIENPIKKQQ